MAHTDCRLTAADGTGITFDVVYWKPLPDNNDAPGYPPLSVRVTIRDASGNTLQEVNELLEPTSPSPVGLQDIDGDGRDEMIIPMSTRVMNGAVNTRFSVWRAEKQTTHFERIQMFGQAIYPSGDGYVVVNSGAFSSRDLDFYLPTAAGYTHIITLTMTTEEVDLNTRRCSPRAAWCTSRRAWGRSIWTGRTPLCSVTRLRPKLFGRMLSEWRRTAGCRAASGYRVCGPSHPGAR